MNTSPAEYPFLAAIVANLADDQPKLIYADWLEEQGDERCALIRKMVAAKVVKEDDFYPAVEKCEEEWLELIGFRLLERIGNSSSPDVKNVALRLARPALRMIPLFRGGTIEEMIQQTVSHKANRIGGSRLGGSPDLPADLRWPPGGDCRAIYNEDTGGTERLAGFLGQINCADVASTQAGALLPPSGLLSFFCFQDMENDNPDAVGVKAIYFPDVSKLVRTEAPQELTQGNTTMAMSAIEFVEVMDLPYGSKYTKPNSGPWGEEIAPVAAAYAEVYQPLYQANMQNILGYARATSGDDPTPSKDSRHLIVLDNAAGCRLHIQIPAQELAARNFDAITLNWVDFD
jgi:uncharacterized protein (TIGR02996 family)